MNQFFLCFLAIPFFSVFSSSFSAETYLKGRIPPSSSRYETFKTALQLMHDRKVKTIVETGTARTGALNFLGDGGSTVLFSQFVKDHETHFFSVDIDEEALLRAQKSIKKFLRNKESYIHFVHRDAIAFLKEFPQQIDFLYLDSYDFDENQPWLSQQHHLSEIEAAYPHLTPQSIVMIDDCDLPHGGKGLLVIDFLLKKGWKILQKGYQVILVY